MTYIINPSWFYWLNVVDNLRCIVIAAISVDLIVLVVCAICFLICAEVIKEFPGVCSGEKKRLPLYEKALKWGLIIFPVLAIVFVFLPYKDTLIEMQVARFATYENAEWTVETVKNAVDYIVEAISKINK